MGGLHGHINHLYEDRDLTFRLLKQIINDVGTGTVEAHEKIDGINLYITIEPETEELRIARNKSQIKEGGLGLEKIKIKFSNRPALMKSLLSSYEALSKAINSVDPEEKYGIFGSSGGIWVSCDIVDPEIYNTLLYNGKTIVFHKQGTRLFSYEGEPLDLNLERNIETLNNNIPKMNEALYDSEWNVSGPIPIPIRPLDSFTINEYTKKIDEIIKRGRVSERETIQQYLYKRLKDEMQRYPLIHPTIKDFIIKRELGIKNMPTINKIAKGLDRSIDDQIKMMAKDCKTTIFKLLLPIENILHSFSVRILSNLKSPLINDAKEEIARLKKETTRCINTIKSSGDLRGQEMLKIQLHKMNSVDEINTAIEGIVFPHGGRVFKLTGFFAPINRICGYIKYKKEESLKPGFSTFLGSAG